MSRRIPIHERGAALIAVLALVALLAGFLTVGIARSRTAVETATAAAERNQARALARSAVALAVADLPRLKAAAAKGQTGAQAILVPGTVPGAALSLAVADAGNCLNINSVTEGGGDVSGVAPNEFARFLAALGMGETDASRLARATAQWADAGPLRADPSEWAAVPGVSPALYAAARPLLCAQPTREPSAVNLNTLTPVHVPLLALLGVPPATARRVLERRPADGFEGADAFWQAAAGGHPPNNAAAGAAGTASRWLSIAAVATVGGETVRQTLLLDSAQMPARVASVDWTR